MFVMYVSPLLPSFFGPRELEFPKGKMSFTVLCVRIPGLGNVVVESSSSWVLVWSETQPL